MNDLTLSAEADSASSSESDMRKPVKLRNPQEARMSSVTVSRAAPVTGKPQASSSVALRQNFVDLTQKTDCSTSQISLKLGVNRKTPMRKQMSRLQMFQQKLLQSEGKYQSMVQIVVLLDRFVSLPANRRTLIKNK